MNKLTLILQDKSVIAELAKDEEVKIRIADAIIDGVRRRSSKLTEGIAQSVVNQLEEEFFDKQLWSRKLSEKIKKRIAKEACSVVSVLVQEESSKIRDEVSIELRNLRLSIRETLATMNIEPFVERYVRQVVREKFNM